VVVAFVVVVAAVVVWLRHPSASDVVVVFCWIIVHV
jgi:hypothetical protein